MLPLWIALRFLRSAKGQTFLIVIGIAIGVSVQIFVGTLLQSLQKNLVETTIGNSPHVTVVPVGDNIVFRDWEAYVEDIGTLEGVKHVSGAADFNALLNTPNNRTFPGLVRGLDLAVADGIYGIYENIYEGEAPDETNRVLVGRENQEEYGLDIDDELEVVLPNGTSETVVICGFFDLKVLSLNRLWVITTLDSAQRIFGFEGGVTVIEMQVDDVFEADAIAGKVRAKISREDVEVKNWKDENEQLLSALSAQNSSSYIIQFFVLASVMIAIASVLAITVMQKSRQIGILKAMGITDRRASLIFTFQGLLLGLGGGVTGVLLGLGLFFLFTTFSGAIPPYVDYWFIVASGFVAVASATFAALIPARKSARLDPIEVIRNG